MPAGPRRPLLLALVVLLALAACAELRPPAIDAPEEEPPADAAEGVVEEETDEGLAAAELTAEPEVVAAGEPVEVVLDNRGEVELSYGRPVTAERWDGEQWVETEASREAVWTMELLILPPGEPGQTQAWPFVEDHTPEPGWYRFTKTAHAATADGEAELTVRARVQVTD